MTYNTFSFFVFFVMLILTYAVIPTYHRWKILLMFSCIFYLFAGLDKFLIVFLTSLVVYYSARKMGEIYEKYDGELKQGSFTPKGKMTLQLQYKEQCKKILIPTLILIVGILAVCKYAGKVFTALNPYLQGIQGLGIIVPLGISYYTFSSVSYLLDVYWKKMKAEKNYFKIFLCMIYFPQIVQGPISRYNRLLIQFENPIPMTYQRFCFGLQLMLWGYFKKMVIADRLLIIVNTVFDNLELYQGFIILVAAVFAVFQLYADFSGCMDIVSGVSEILGIELEKNFDHPFFSKSVAEFWRRWHVTLGTWFKDYIYFPLATSPRIMKLVKKTRNKWGNQAGKNLSVIIPLSAVWLLTGIWHGTGWNYLIWGIYYGVFIICSNILSGTYERLAEKCHIRTDRPEWKIFQMVRTFILFMIGRMIVLPGSLIGIILEIKQSFASFNPWVFFDGSLYKLGLDRSNFILALLCIVLLMVIENLQIRYSLREEISRMNIVIRWGMYYLAIFSIVILGMYGSGFSASAFVYGQF